MMLDYWTTFAATVPPDKAPGIDWKALPQRPAASKASAGGTDVHQCFAAGRPSKPSNWAFCKTDR